MLAVPLAVGAQPARNVARIGIFGDKAADASEKHLWQVFLAGLREHGWSEGAWAEGNAARLPELAAQLIRLKPDVIVTRGSLFTGALKAATSSIPIVFVGHADPVETGHVASLARPGGNITGVAVLQTELGPKSLELLHAVVPSATRVARRRALAPGHAVGSARARGAGGSGANARPEAAARRGAERR